MTEKEFNYVYNRKISTMLEICGKYHSPRKRGWLILQEWGRGKFTSKRREGAFYDFQTYILGMVSRGCVKRLAGDTAENGVHSVVPVLTAVVPGSCSVRLLSPSEVFWFVWQSIWLLYSRNSDKCASKYPGKKKGNYQSLLT